MRRMSLSLFFPFAPGLAIALSTGGSAVADPAAPKLTDLRIERESSDLAAPRGGPSFHGEFVTMRHELDNFPLNEAFFFGLEAPVTSFTGPAGFEWPPLSVFSQYESVFMRNLAAQPVNSPNGVTNTTRAIQVTTFTPAPPGSFRIGARLSFGGTANTNPTLQLSPSPDHNARVSADYYISTINEQYTFEAGAAFIGNITGRLMWGGTCIDTEPGQCASIGLPSGPIPTMYSLELGNPASQTGVFAPARFCTDNEGNPIPDCVAPAGFAVGDLVAPPIGNWSRFAAETTQDGRLRFLLDLYDGSGETTIVDQPIVISPFIDRVFARTSFEASGAFLLIDNVEASGTVWAPPAPPALVCPYADDIEWMLEAPVLGQQRWRDIRPFESAVIVDDQAGKIIRQTNDLAPDNHHRIELATEVRSSSVSLNNDVIVSVRLRTSGETVRAIAPGFGIDIPVARVFLGRVDPTDPETPGYRPRVYVQINREYEPVDDPESGDPFGNIPVVGVDVADTGYDWAPGEFRTLEFRVSRNNALRVSIDGARIYAGTGYYPLTISRLIFESENNADGAGATLDIDDVATACALASCATDFDFDDATTFADLNAVLSNFGAAGLPSLQFNPGDTNGDRDVDFDDLNAVLSAFGTSCD